MSHSGGNHKIHSQKKAAEAAFLAVPYYPLDSSNVFRLRTFLALGNGELNLLALHPKKQVSQSKRYYSLQGIVRS
jgi:hypothetical protein